MAEPVIVPYLKNIFNIFFDKDIFPEELSKAIIISLHKKEIRITRIIIELFYCQVF